MADLELSVGVKKFENDMSKPIRNSSCGCLRATVYNRHDKKPFWTWYGYDEVTEKQTCPIHKRVTHRLEILTPFGRVIGHLKWNEGPFSQYITIDKHQNRKWFFGKDVYCNECDKWHYA